tara:strand:+ start:4219 stop:6273 length:2055 start_codon:yes stop_codon:yes gene_type:complete
MAKQIGDIELKFDVTGLEDLTTLSRGLKNLKQSLEPVKGRFKGLAQAIGDVTKFTPKTISQFKKKERVLKSLREEVRAGGVGFKRLGKEIDANRIKLQQFTQTAVKQKGIFAGLGAGGAAAIGGAGAYIGSSLGLPPAISGLASAGAAASAAKAGTGIMSGAGLKGGLVGAGIGAAVAGVAGTVSFASESATYAAEIQKLQIALKGVTKDNATFQKGLDVIATTSKRLNVPIAASTKQFTTLSASVLGAGGTIEQAEEVFVGVSNAIKATGGNADDVQSAIRAMSQIFGKGKVSAEELQGQLGERLAGAVVKFAEANGSSLAKLQKDLRDGTVGLDQVIKFAEKLNEDFADTANKVANSSADAGQRLKTTMDRLKLAVGTILQPIGAEFQRVFGDIVEFITKAIEKFNEFMGIGLENAVKKQEKILERMEEQILKQRNKNVQNRLFEDFKVAVTKYADLMSEFNIGDDKGEGGGGSGLPDLEDTSKSPLQSFADSAFKVAEQAEQAFVSAFKGMEDALVKFVMTGKLNFKDLANSIIADLTRMLIRAAVTKPLFGALFPNLANGGVVSGGEIVPSANGNVFAKNKIVPYKMGGIVNKPTLFPMANGMGLMGEAGPEAVMPLKRGANGKLGVQSSGGVGNIVVNVDASGSSIQGDSAQGEQFGRALAAAIQSELIQQKRPGGLLS